MLPRYFYLNDNVVDVARRLIGKLLVTEFGGVRTSGVIVETEAYCGRNDQACHANNGSRTPRTEVMYCEGGVGYIYLCYGIHHLFNVVTNKKDYADAVLIRGLEPVDGIETMLKRRKLPSLKRNLTAGPGALAQALGINYRDSGISLLGPQVWIERTNKEIDSKRLIASPRVGIEYAGNDAGLPWRFRLRDSRWVSPAR
ncbi:MAG: DNA-3-methyladenine glycosylase [Verrucomicrobiota bacterium]